MHATDANVALSIILNTGVNACFRTVQVYRTDPNAKDIDALLKRMVVFEVAQYNDSQTMMKMAGSWQDQVFKTRDDSGNH